MHILPRYVFVELIKVFAVSLGVMTLMMFLGIMGKEAVDTGLGLGGLLRLTPYILPEAMQFTLPGALLLATTGVFGRIAASNEIVAIKSLGISPMVMVWPTVVLSVLISFAAVLINDMAVSWGREGRDRVVLESLETIAYSQLQTRHHFEMGPISVRVRGVDGKKLINPTITREGRGSKPTTIINAEIAEFQLLPEEGKLVVEMKNAEHRHGEESDAVAPEFRDEFSLDDLLGKSDSNRSPSNHSLSEIGPAKIEQRKLIAEAEQDMTTRAAFSMLTGDFDELSDDRWKQHEKSLVGAKNRLSRFNTEPYRRWSNGFSCLCFAAVGIPVAIIFRKGEFLASFFKCFLPILLIYYPVFMGAQVLAKDGVVPPQSVWLANIVIFCCGLVLMRRVIRY